jgi:hypothetical protein
MITKTKKTLTNLVDIQVINFKNLLKKGLCDLKQKIHKKAKNKKTLNRLKI